jgi:heme o synthase
MRPVYWFKSITGNFFSLIKISQTLLLVLTGITGFLSFGESLNPGILLLDLFSSLFLAISGCTILNMVYDRDIDQKMTRTASDRKSVV